MFKVKAQLKALLAAHSQADPFSKSPRTYKWLMQEMPKPVESQIPASQEVAPVPPISSAPATPLTHPQQEPREVAPTPLDEPETPWPEPELSKSAVDKRLRRVFQPLKDGSYKVSADFVKQWGRPGPERNKLYVLFEKCNYSPDWMV